MTSPELYDAEGWDGIERRAGGANPLRVAVTFDREKWIERVRGAQTEHRSAAVSTSDSSAPAEGDSFVVKTDDAGEVDDQ